jgi:HAD superfamily hydrolase (TIGR01450 family)
MTELTTIRELTERYDTILFDSYGVLVDESYGLAGARELIDWLESTGKSYYIVTNDASRSIPSRAGKFIEQGVPVPQERIINSGCLIPRFFRENNLKGAPTIVFGSPDAYEYVTDGGADILPHDRLEDAAVFVLADDACYDWRSRLNDLITTLNRKVLDGQEFTLLLPNPDIIYPSGERAYSFAAAALADMIEAALIRLFGDDPAHRFTRLGKPFAPIFDEAVRRASDAGAGKSFVIIGDQLETDIAGANAYGIPSTIVTTGINRLRTTQELAALPLESRPTYLLPNLKVD